MSHWRLRAPLGDVWAALIRPQDWPGWWPNVRRVRTLHAGDASGLGSVRRIEWRTGLPYSLTVDVELTEVLHLERLRGRARGHQRGEGIWLLRQDGEFTQLTYLWRVELTQPWMRWLAPFLAPLFRWNHARVMRAGEAGLARQFEAQRRSATGRAG